MSDVPVVPPAEVDPLGAHRAQLLLPTAGRTGLLQRGSIIELTADVRRNGGKRAPKGSTGIVQSATYVDIVGRGPQCDMLGGWTGFFPSEAVALDLALVTSRIRATTWLSEQLGLEPSAKDLCSGPRWRWDGFDCWMLSWRYNEASEVTRVFAPTISVNPHVTEVAVPALAALDPKCELLLRDGSRWVDAQALWHCCQSAPGTPRLPGAAR